MGSTCGFALSILVKFVKKVKNFIKKKEDIYHEPLEPHERQELTKVAVRLGLDKVY